LQSIGHLTLKQRYTIQVLLKEGLNQSLTAKRLKRDKSVIQREIKRNCDLRSGEYKADLADKKCSNRHKTKNKHIRFTLEIKCLTKSLIREDYNTK
jgi:IS30 family transposase